jgi:hypothetical protein
MRRTEEEVLPGIYLTRLTEPTSLTVDQYVASLRSTGMLRPELLAQERARLELSIAKLEESNAILAEEDDEDCRQAVVENRDVIAKQRQMLEKLSELLGEDPGLYI